MELFTLNRKFLRQDIIDGFHSAIWTERYYGDSDIELVVPATPELMKKLLPGTFVGLIGSDEVMILETFNIEEGKLKVTGISLLPWLNNRFVRTSALHKERQWTVGPGAPGWILWAIVYYMCVTGSPFLNGTIDTGISNPQQLAIPGLVYNGHDVAGDNITVGVPYGPVYDAMREIATTYQVGMQITLLSATDTSYSLGFRSYRGLDRTSRQTTNPVVRFSPQMDSLTDIKELQSIAMFKTLAYTFAPGYPEDAKKDLEIDPGVSALSGSQYTGFDLRALLVFADDITTGIYDDNDQPVPPPDPPPDPPPPDWQQTYFVKLTDVLNSRSRDGLDNNPFVRAVDGEIVPTNQFQYGVHYNLGDVIEVQGNSDIVSTSRVTEYIRAQDSAGERAYPTVAMLG
jgi:Siphovirus ReqiPepy6 Gp37-like protein